MGQSPVPHRWCMRGYKGVMVWRDKLQGDTQRQDKYVYYRYKRLMLSDNNTIIMARGYPCGHVQYYIYYYTPIQLLYIIIIIYIVTTRYDHWVYSLLSHVVVALACIHAYYTMDWKQISLEWFYSCTSVYNSHDIEIIKNNDLFEGARRRFFEKKTQNLVYSLAGQFLTTLHVYSQTAVYNKYKRCVRNTAGLRTITAVIHYCCQKNNINVLGINYGYLGI